MDVYVSGKRIHLDPKQAIGKGGEADVYDIGGDRALKVFKQPDHPDYQGLAVEQEGARRRIAEHQRKLREFPAGLPSRVVAPLELATDRKGSIVGYAMRHIRGAEVLRRYGDRTFRSGGVATGTVADIFRDLHATVRGVHAAGVVIGDFNDLNVLVSGTEAYGIDADSMQFGSYHCTLFTARFVDPLKCDPKVTSPALVRPHDASSDWYAFAVMLFGTLLFVDPYGGVYVPKRVQDRIPHDQRPLKRITVFHPDVRFPKVALPFGVLPDDLLEHFHRMFERDARGEFPLTLLEALRWTHCTACGTEHARAVCPSCAQAAPAAVRSMAVVRGTVTATRIFRTRGTIVAACAERGELRWLCHEGDEFRRENGTIVLHGDLDPRIRYRIRGPETLLGRDGTVMSLAPGREPEARSVDAYHGRLPVFATNGDHTYWLAQGRVLRDGEHGPERIGDALAGQTLLWVGDRFGFGMYRAGGLQVAFVFDAERHGVNDTVALASIPGHLIDASAAFAHDRCWFLAAYEIGGKTTHRATVIRGDGTIEATAEAPSGDGTWLGRGIRGIAAAGAFALVPTDDGVVRVEASGRAIVETKRFPDTEPFIDAGSRLLIVKDGLAVVDRQEITILTLQ